MRFLGIGLDQFTQGYGMQEASSGGRMNEWGRYELPGWIVPLLLDDTGEHLLDVREGQATGRMALFDVSIDGRWGGIISGDRVTIDFDPSPTGRPGPAVTTIDRYSDLEGGDDKLTCAGTIDSFVRGVVGSRPVAVTASTVGVPHVIKGRLIDDATEDFGAFRCPTIDLDDLVWPRTDPGPAFDTPIDEIIDFLDEVGQALDFDTNAHMQEALEATIADNPLEPRIIENTYRAIPVFFDRPSSSSRSSRRQAGPDRRLDPGRPPSGRRDGYGPSRPVWSTCSPATLPVSR